MRKPNERKRKKESMKENKPTDRSNEYNGINTQILKE